MRSHSNSWQTALRAGLVAASVLGGALEGVPAAQAETPAIVREAPSMDALVERQMARIRSSKSLPGWAVEAAVNAYTAYKTYRNGQRVEEIGGTVLAVLKKVEDMKADADKGRAMSEREVRLTRELLASYSARLRADEERLASHEERLQAHESMLASVAGDAKAVRARFAAWLSRNRVCREAEHVWRPALGRCVLKSEAGPRR